MLRAAFVIDYQNTHLVAHNVFEPNAPVHESLIHPMQMARAATHERNRRQRPGYEDMEVACVKVFRGWPSATHAPDQHRRNALQANAWEADGADVHLRPLKYHVRDGQVIGKGREKGIDVLVALEVLRQARRGDIDVVILSSTDTDLIPAMDEALIGGSVVETVSWFERGQQHNPRLEPTVRRIWNTNLGRDVFGASVDRNDYR